jgi:hypothetical protein
MKRLSLERFPFRVGPSLNTLALIGAASVDVQFAYDLNCKACWGLCSLSGIALYGSSSMTWFL